MGMPPREVAASSLWHFMAALDGYGRATGWNVEDEPETMPLDKLRALGIDGF